MCMFVCFKTGTLCFMLISIIINMTSYDSQHLEIFVKAPVDLKEKAWLFVLSLLVAFSILSFVCFVFPDGQSSCSSVSTSTKSLSLNLKNRYSNTLDQLITSTSVWPSTQVDCSESYLNLLNLENSSKPAVSVNGDLDLFSRANGTADKTEDSCNEIVPFTLRNSANMDEK